MPVVLRDGAELYWEKIGTGPALILGAGLNGSGTWWAPNRLALAERFTVYTFDQRGTGRSSKIPVASIEQMAADLVAVMDNAGLESAHYAGHSTGGGIGVATQAMAIAGGDIESSSGQPHPRLAPSRAAGLLGATLRTGFEDLRRAQV